MLRCSGDAPKAYQPQLPADGNRNITDEQIKAAAATGGLVGFPGFVSASTTPTLDEFIDHIDYVVKLVGDDHVGRGIDYYWGQVPIADDAEATQMYEEAVAAGTWQPETYPPPPYTKSSLNEARKHNLYIVMGMARLEEDYPHLVYNSLCFVGPDGMVEHYDKIHLGTFHPYIEGVFFAPGHRAPVFDTRLGRVSLQICYDVSFPELTRTYAVKGSVLNLVISAGPSVAKDSWRILLQARSMENLFPSVYCNVVGAQKDFTFFGGSKIVSATGEVTAEAKFDEEDFIVGTVDIAEAILLRRQWLMLRERRPDLYAPLTAPPPVLPQGGGLAPAAPKDEIVRPFGLVAK